jgi:DNA polymerase III psi subunit
MLGSIWGHDLRGVCTCVNSKDGADMHCQHLLRCVANSSQRTLSHVANSMLWSVLSSFKLHKHHAVNHQPRSTQAICYTMVTWKWMQGQAHQVPGNAQTRTAAVLAQSLVSQCHMQQGRFQHTCTHCTHLSHQPLITQHNGDAQLE